MIRTLLEKRVLHKFRLFKKMFCISIDGTGYANFTEEPYEGCPFRKYKNGKKVWFQPVLEAKLVGLNGFCLSIVIPSTRESLMWENGTNPEYSG